MPGFGMGQGVIKQPSRRSRGWAEGGVEFRSFLFEALNAAMLSPSVAMLSARILAAVPRLLVKRSGCEAAAVSDSRKGVWR